MSPARRAVIGIDGVRGRAVTAVPPHRPPVPSLPGAIPHTLAELSHGWIDVTTRPGRVTDDQFDLVSDDGLTHRTTVTADVVYESDGSVSGSWSAQWSSGSWTGSRLWRVGSTDYLVPTIEFDNWKPATGWFYTSAPWRAQAPIYVEKDVQGYGSVRTPRTNGEPERLVGVSGVVPTATFSVWLGYRFTDGTWGVGRDPVETTLNGTTGGSGGNPGIPVTLPGGLTVQVNAWGSSGSPPNGYAAMLITGGSFHGWAHPQIDDFNMPPG